MAGYSIFIDGLGDLTFDANEFNSPEQVQAYINSPEFVQYYETNKTLAPVEEPGIIERLGETGAMGVDKLQGTFIWPGISWNRAHGLETVSARVNLDSFHADSVVNHRHRSNQARLEHCR